MTTPNFVADSATAQQMVSEALAGLRDVVADIKAAEPSEARLKLAKRITGRIPPIAQDATDIRNAGALDLWDAGQMATYAELGRYIGVTAARAHAIVRAREAKADAPPPPVPSLPEIEIGEADLATAHYRLYDAAETLLYTGIADNLKERFDAHRKDSSWWPQVTRRTVTWYGSRRDALRAEDIAIKAEHPVHNIAGVIGTPADKLEPYEETLAGMYETPHPSAA
jgi:predicted GIY-YIG superfamily endonuclease